MSNIRFHIEFGMHQLAVNHLCADAAGRFVVTGSPDQELRVWDLQGEWPCMLLDTGSRTAAISPDGELLALRFAEESPAALCLVERRSGRLLRWLPSRVDFRSLVFSRDGQRLLLQGNRGLELREVATGRCLLSFDDDPGIYDADMDDAGRLVVVARSGTRLLLLDGNGHEAARTWPEEDRFERARFTPDGRHITITCAGGRGELRSSRSLELRARVACAGAAVLAWSADGTTLYAGGNGVVHVLAERGQAPRRSVAVPGQVKALCPTPKGVLFGTDAPAWGLLDQALQTQSVHTWPRARFSADPTSLHVSADGRCVAFRLASGEECCFSARLGEGLLAARPPHVELLPPGTAAPWLKLFPAARKLRIRHAEDEEKERTEEYELVVVSPDGSCCLTSKQGVLTYYDAYHLENLWAEGCGGGILAVNISGDGQLVIVVHDDGTITWHAARNGEKRLTLLLHEEPARWVAFTAADLYDGPAAALIGWQVTQSQPLEASHGAAKNYWKFLSEIGPLRPTQIVIRQTPAEAEAKRLRDEHARAHQLTYGAVAELAGYRELHGTYLNPDYVPAGLLAQHAHRPEQVYAALDAPLAAKALWMGQRAKISADPAQLRLSPDGRGVAFRLAMGEERYFSMQPGAGLLTTPLAGVALAPPCTAAPWLALRATDTGQRAVIRTRDEDEKEYECEQVAVSPDGAYCLLSQDRDLRYIEARSDNQQWGLDNPARTLAVNISGDGQLVVSALADGSLSWRAAADGKEVLTLVLHADGQRWAAFTPDGDFIGALPQLGSHHPAQAYAALDVPLAAKQLWTMQRAELSARPAELLVSDDGLTIGFQLASGEVRCFRVAPDGGLSAGMSSALPLSPPCTAASWIQVFEDDKQLRMRQPDDDQRERDQAFDVFAVSRDGAHCVVCKGNDLRYFTASPLDYSNSHLDVKRCLAVNLSGDGRLIVAVHEAGTICWYASKDQAPLLTLVLHADGQQWALFGKDGQFVATPPLARGWHSAAVYAALRDDPQPSPEATPQAIRQLLPPLISLQEVRLAGAEGVSRLRVVARTPQPLVRLRLRAAGGPELVFAGAALDTTFIPSANPSEEQHELSFRRSAVGEGELTLTAETEHAVSAPLVIASAVE